MLHFNNRQKTKAVDLPLLRKITRCLLEELLEQSAFELAVHLVAAPEMAALNEKFLQHEGSTDVITFDYAEPESRGGEAGEFSGGLEGEIFVSVDDAIGYARQFRATWQSELVRYIVHGVLHLRGYDDLKPKLRRAMKRQENLLLTKLSQRFAIGQVERRQVRPQRRTDGRTNRR